MKTKNSWQLRAFRAAAVGFILLTSLSCSPEPFPTEVCVHGDCQATFNLGSGIDANGYYHVKLNYNGLYDDRFTINSTASAVTPKYYYNDMPAVSATFKGDKSIEIPIAAHLNLTEVIPVVQETQVYYTGQTSWLYKTYSWAYYS